MQLAELNQLVSDGLASGEVRPLPINVFPRTDIEEAFRFMASGGAFKAALCSEDSGHCLWQCH